MGALKDSYKGTQSQGRERVRCMLARLLPEYECGAYPVLVLRRWQREIDSGDTRPAWSLAVRHKANGRLIEVYCQETISDVLFWGRLMILYRDGSSIRVMPDQDKE